MLFLGFIGVPGVAIRGCLAVGKIFARLIATVHTYGARVITRTVDAVAREKRIRNDKFLRSSILALKNRREDKIFSKVLAYPEELIYKIEPRIGFTRFDSPKAQTPLVKQAIRNIQAASREDSWTGKSYFRSLKAIADYPVDSPEFQLATSPQMPKSVASYLDRLPLLLDISACISLSDPDNPGGQLSGSQLFHRDLDDIASVTVWVLCSQVNAENGPTVLLPAQASHQVARQIGYKQGDKVPDDSAFLPYKDEFFEAVGPPGSSFATDTCSSFHYRSRVSQSRERLVLYFQYVSSRVGWAGPPWRH